MRVLILGWTIQFQTRKEIVISVVIRTRVNNCDDFQESVGNSETDSSFHARFKSLSCNIIRIGRVHTRRRVNLFVSSHSLRLADGDWIPWWLMVDGELFEWFSRPAPMYFTPSPQISHSEICNRSRRYFTFEFQCSCATVRNVASHLPGFDRTWLN